MIVKGGSLLEAGVEPYELEPIRILMGPNEFVDIPIRHPLRYHSKGAIHLHSP